MPKSVIIAGFFPPPITGQGLATQRLAELLAPHYDVHAVNLREGEDELNLQVYGRIMEKVKSYRTAGQRLGKVLHAYPDATVFWTAISPQPFGHLRDLLTIAPGFLPTHQVYAVVHWGKFANLYQSPLTTWTARHLTRRLKGIVCLNKDRSHQLAPWIPEEKRIVIPNTLDEAVLCTEEEVAAKQAAASSRKQLRALFLSNMIPEKGYWDVLEAVRLLHNQGLDIHATFAGQWLHTEDERRFDEYVTQHDLNDVVTHVGIVRERRRIKALQLQHDVFLLPSYLIEGQPLTIIEALNAGSPIITTRIGGMVDMIREGVEGFFVPPKDPSAIAQALERLASSTTTRASMSVAARKRYNHTYGADAVKAHWMSLIENP